MQWVGTIMTRMGWASLNNYWNGALTTIGMEWNEMEFQ